MKQQRWSYFRSQWNLLELSIILLSWCAVGVFTWRTLTGNQEMSYYHQHPRRWDSLNTAFCLQIFFKKALKAAAPPPRFASFYETASADRVLQYLVAFLVLLSTVKLWHLFRINPKMNVFTATLGRAWSDMSSFLLILGLLLVAYSMAVSRVHSSSRAQDQFQHVWGGTD